MSESLLGWIWPIPFFFLRDCGKEYEMQDFYSLDVSSLLGNHSLLLVGRKGWRMAK
jgi:hypothetical protein